MPPVATAAISKKAGPRRPWPAGTGARASGRASATKPTNAAVASPSTIPMARWIGCINSTNAPKGSAEMPEAFVSSTTPNAPSCSPTTAATSAAIHAREPPPRARGR